MKLSKFVIFTLLGIFFGSMGAVLFMNWMLVHFGQ